MRFSTTLLAAAVPLAAYAAPVSKRQIAAIDVTVLQFADVLEQLESQFYAAGLSQFQSSDYTAAGFTASSLAIQQITNIQSNEATHDTALQVSLTDVSTMLATARVVENLGVMAYLGAASLITDPQLLEIAGSILTTEARHQTMLNVLSGTGTAIPSPFDLALTPSEVLAVASPFISGACDLGVPANPTLSITNTGTVSQGTSLTFSSSALNSSVDLSNASCQMLIGGNPISISLPLDQCVVPNTVNGPVAIFITSDNDPLQPDPVNRASANNILAGPAVAFIDASPEVIGQMVRTGTSTAAASNVTTTISPAAAASLASGTDVASAPAATDASSTGTASASASTDASSVGSASNSSSVGSASNSTASSVNDLSSDSSAPFLNTFTGAAGPVNVIGWSNV
ncbi:hypothetical protein BT96DRAFT_924985 [Gymnopus androsaceus JB14]|uniref:Ferritin-like domain-containing protein n=1 Tax=Gymnopus androsaceus JB14 TaxID=1447944 RepID=A0A6A4H2L7_9AGAR|nr:hypothetical protein BT96DRAFT_924985 [Gymnopus androsaceus JB14]